MAAAVLKFPAPPVTSDDDAPAQPPVSELGLVLIATARTELDQCTPTALAKCTPADLVQTIERLRSTLSGLLCADLPPQTGWSALWEAEAVNLAVSARSELVRLAGLLARAIGRMAN